MTNDLGTLVIVILKAKNLPDKHSFRKQDVFAQVQIQDNIKMSSVDIKGGQHPVWDEEVRVPVAAKATDETRILHVSCWSQEPRTPEVIGKGKIDISETLRTGEFDDWIPLVVEGVYKGELYLEMTFFAAGPPPSLSRRPSKFSPKDRLARSSQQYDHNSTLRTNFVSNPSTQPPAIKDTMLPSLPEAPDVAPTAIPSLLRAGRPPTSSQHPPSDTASFRSPASSPPRSPPQLVLAPASLRPGRPLSQGGAYRDDSSAASRYASYRNNPYLLSSSPPQSHAETTAAPSPSSYSQTKHPAPPIYDPYGSVHTSLTPEPHAGPAPPRVPQPSIELAYAPPYLRSAREPLQSAYVTSEYSISRASDTYNSGDPSYFPLPALPPPQVSPSLPYPYNCAPPPRDPDLHAPQFRLGTHGHGHRSSFPLPDESESVITPTPAHPHGYVSPPRHANPPLPPKQFNQYSAQPGSHRVEHQRIGSLSSVPSQKSHEQGSRDGLLALAMEREEEERKRYLTAQEEHDMELARKLDLELNLEQEHSRETVFSQHAGTSSGMPGGW